MSSEMAEIETKTELTPTDEMCDIPTSTVLMYLDDQKLLTTTAVMLQCRSVHCSTRDATAEPKTQQDEKGGEGGKGEGEAEYTIVLDRSPMYPQGGGQPSDEGLIKFPNGTEFKVTKVNRVKLDSTTTATSARTVVILEHNGYFTSHPAAPLSHPAVSRGTKCDVIVDGAIRRLHNQLHSAGHLLDIAVLGQDYLSLPFTIGRAYHFPASPYVEYKLLHSAVCIGSEGELRVRGNYGDRESEVIADLSAVVALPKPTGCRGGKKGKVKDKDGGHSLPPAAAGDRNAFKVKLEETVNRLLTSEKTTLRIVRTTMSSLRTAAAKQKKDSGSDTNMFDDKEAKKILQQLPAGMADEESVRLVGFGRFWLGPCCGTHCESGGDVGKIVIRKLVVSGKKQLPAGAFPSEKNGDDSQEIGGEGKSKEDDAVSIRVCYDVARQ